MSTGNVFVERLWYWVKQEDSYLKDCYTGLILFNGLEDCFPLYNYVRPYLGLAPVTLADARFSVNVPILWLNDLP